MNRNFDYTQLMVWVVQLTAQADYQGLTHLFIDILERMPGVDHASVFEIYGDRNYRTGEASSVDEQLIRRFPLDFSAPEQGNNLEVAEMSNTEGLMFSKPNAEGLFTRLARSINDVSGPRRAVLLQGLFDPHSIQALSDLIAVYRNQVALHDSKERDLLTKLPNRQSFDARILQVCEYFRNQKPHDPALAKGSWIAMLDIDFFKRINDNFGHLSGDEVLLVFSQQMEKHFRYNDFLFRFGGEEFVVILNLVNRENAELAFERFRKAIARHDFPTVGRVTVSIGATQIVSGIMPSVLLDRADKALYHAKDNGRNRLSLHENIADSINAIDDGDTELF